MLFGKLKKAIRKFLMLDEPTIEEIDFALHKTLIEASQTEKSYTVKPNASARSLCGSYVYEEPANNQNYNYPHSCHIIIPSKPGSQAIRKVSPKHFKPRTAHEKRLLKPKAKLEEEN
jgi:hypothetical protein